MNIPRRSLPGRGYFIASVATAIWSTAAVFIGYLTTHFHMPPLVLAFWREVIVACTLGVALALVARPLLHLGRQHVPFLVLYGLALAVLNALWTASVALNGAAIGTALVYSSPAFTALAGWRWWNERLDAQKIGAIVLSIVGVVFASGAYDRAAWQINPAGIVVGVVAGGAFAAYSLLGKLSVRRGVNPWTATLYSFVFGATFLLFLQRPGTFLWRVQPVAAGPWEWGETLRGWGTLGLLAVGPTLVGYGLYTVSLTYLPASTANLILTLEPAMTAGLAFVFLGERFTLPQFLGGALILTGVMLLRISDRAANGARVPPSASRQQSK